MKTTILTIVAFATAISFTACNNDDNNAIETSKYITVDAGVGSLTRATATAFEKADEISVYAWTGSNTTVPADLVVFNSINTYDGKSWTANPKMLWNDLTTPHFFIGVYPTKGIVDFAADHYINTPDVLVANVLGEGRKASNGIVPMTFDHIMARLDVNLSFRDQWNGTPTVTSVSTQAQPEATVNYLTKTATTAGSVKNVKLTAQTANTIYVTTVAPQSINKIDILIEGKMYTYNHPTPLKLEKGKMQTINLIVGRDQITLGSVTINNWGTGEEINGGEAQID